MVAEAIQNRPELRELRLRLQATQRFEDAERDLKHPNVSVIAAAGVLPYINNPTSTSIPWGYEGIGVNVEIPIFNGHLFSARAQAAHYESQAQDQRLRNQQQMIEHDVRAAWIAASTAYQSIPVTVQYLREAQLALELANGRYGLGLSSIVELTQAQLNLTQAQIENVNCASTIIEKRVRRSAIHNRRTSLILGCNYLNRHWKLLHAMKVWLHFE